MDHATHTHEFTLSGLGLAPFKFLGVRKNLFRMPDGTSKPGGCCAHCSQGILYEYLIRSADGVVSAVGCDCIRKAGDKGLIKLASREKNRLEREKREAARLAKREADLDAQRSRNGGPTDYEVRQAARETERRGRLARMAPVVALADALADGCGRFRDSVANDIRNGRMPSPRAQEIIIEILGDRAKAAFDAVADASA